MRRKIQVIAILTVLAILISIISSFCSDVSNAVTQSTSSDISSLSSSAYPGIKELIEELQEEHPNWNFEILYTGIDWSDAITYEYTGHRKLTKKFSSK